MGRLEPRLEPHAAAKAYRELYPHAGGPKRRSPRVTVAASVAVLLWISWAVLTSLLAPVVTHGGNPAHTAGGDNELMTDWELIEPSEDLHWVPCFRALDDFLCARLTVPMDYNRPLNQSTPFAKSHPKVHIALIMLPGKNHTESGAWSESPLLVNPGGPGGSGTEIVKSAGRAQQEIAGSDLDIVGFDPRGIGATTPQANCFLDPSVDTEAQSPYERRVSKEDALIRRVLWMTENAVVGLPNSSSTATEQTVFRARGLTKLCNFQDDQDSILRFAGTPNVAQDMLSIVQAWDKWSAGLGRKPERHQESSLETALPELDGANGVASPPSTRGKLVYWGFSYGTVLGATFATMFPEHVGRMVLDGVVNSDEWYFENSWKNAPQDLEKVIERFQLYCYQAQERCHLYREGDKLEDVKRRYDSVLQSLADEPRVYAKKGYMPVYITYSSFKSLLFTVAYAPSFFPVIGMALDALHRGVDMATFVQPVDLSSLCEATPRIGAIKSLDDGGTAVLCSDQRFRLNETKTGMEAELAEMLKVSAFGDVTFSFASRCTGWDIDHADPPSMDWDKFPLKDGDPVNTSFPILFVSNTRDPVTPIRSGLLQSRKFLDAGFIEQKSEGHCSVAMVSVCTMRRIRAYFGKGVVPEKPRFDDDDDGDGLTGNWTTCEVDQRPWGVPGLEMRLKEEVDSEEVALLRAGEHLRKTFKKLAGVPSYPHGFEKVLGMKEEEVEVLLAEAMSRDS